MSPEVLGGLRDTLNAKRNDDLLVGMETSDDAAIYRVSDDLALVQTLDYITPVCTDPFLYGQVAAANSLSDVYAMGGRCVTAMNICCFPQEAGSDILGKILAGGLSKIEESGAVLVGGHTVRDDEMKYGLSVTGYVHPKRYTPNTGARAGDRLILTKPIGTGVHISGSRRGLVSDEQLQPVLNTMATLNRVACETMMEFEVRGATDITGFGLAGHAWHMARGSGVTLRFDYDALPRFPETMRLLQQGVQTGVTRQNISYTQAHLRFSENLSPWEQLFLFDPQTSGGLLIAIRDKDADALLQKLKQKGVGAAALVGSCIAAETPIVDVVRR